MCREEIRWIISARKRYHEVSNIYVPKRIVNKAQKYPYAKNAEKPDTDEHSTTKGVIRYDGATRHEDNKEHFAR